MPAMRWDRFIHCPAGRYHSGPPYSEDDMDHDHVEDAFPESCDDLPDDLRELLGPFHIEEMYRVTGATYADNLRHGCARVQLLDCLDEDPQVLAHLQAWGREIG